VRIHVGVAMRIVRYVRDRKRNIKFNPHVMLVSSYVKKERE
jgi:hypothetical protein